MSKGNRDLKTKGSLYKSLKVVFRPVDISVLLVFSFLVNKVSLIESAVCTFPTKYDGYSLYLCYPNASSDVQCS